VKASLKDKEVHTRKLESEYQKALQAFELEVLLISLVPTR